MMSKEYRKIIKRVRKSTCNLDLVIETYEWVREASKVLSENELLALGDSCEMNVLTDKYFDLIEGYQRGFDTQVRINVHHSL